MVKPADRKKGVVILYSRWWANQRFAQPNEGLSILDLVDSGTIDCRLSSLLWILMEQRTSVLVAAGPSYAGKTTLLHATLDFLPPDLEQIALRGYYEDFKFLEHSRPDNTYLVTEEISNHQYEYLWGIKALRTFTLVSQGYSLGAALHARTPEESIYVLNKWLGIPMGQISRLGIIIILQASAGKEFYDEPIRRVNSVSLIIPAKEGIAIQVLAARQHAEKGFAYLSHKDLQTTLDSKYSMRKGRLGEELDTRERYLKHLRKIGKTSRQEVRSAIIDFYKSKLGK
jgi:type IV secretory pathway ATPase VirB11/archaellum biosynthesis ATPase